MPARIGAPAAVAVATPGRPVHLAEPRVACARCGAHVVIEGRVGDQIFVVCPVCELRWQQRDVLESPSESHDEGTRTPRDVHERS